MISQFSLLTARDIEIARHYLGDLDREPDVTLAPDGVDKPYLYRWHIRKDNALGNIYFHMQVDHDPLTRPLHDHPWDNSSVILAGGYIEHMQIDPPHSRIWTVRRHVGEMIFRHGRTAHRLELPKNVPYTLTQFVTGPKNRDWG